MFDRILDMLREHAAALAAHDGVPTQVVHVHAAAAEFAEWLSHAREELMGTAPQAGSAHQPGATTAQELMVQEVPEPTRLLNVEPVEERPEPEDDKPAEGAPAKENEPAGDEPEHDAPVPRIEETEHPEHVEEPHPDEPWPARKEEPAP